MLSDKSIHTMNSQPSSETSSPSEEVYPGLLNDEEDAILALETLSIPDESEENGLGDGLEAEERLSKVDESEVLKPRAYQLEMLEKSLKQNIIVAMDTGSGKTQVAVLRIQAQLETCRPGRRVWFLAPTVVLCAQQYSVLRSQLPSVQMLHLSSADNVDRWTKQSLWDAVLLNVQVVVSTHQILLDALSHGFVSMEDLTLLVFDEAHYCQGKHPACLIMEDFYQPRIRSSRYVPQVLGLTASPIVNSKGGLEILEKNLNAISKTPKLHRSQMMKHVHRPTLVREIFHLENPPPSSVYKRLFDTYRSMDLLDDPYVIELSSNMTTKNMNTLEKIFMNQKTYSQTVIKGLCSRSTAVGLELGGWARDYYIYESIRHIRKNMTDHLFGHGEWSNAERLYLLEIFDKIGAPAGHEIDPICMPDRVSKKVDRLIDILVREHKDNFSCIVFVQQRVVVILLSLILSLHPETATRFSSAPFVGSSVSPKRSGGMTDLVDLKAQKNTIEDLREGKTNVILATSVLEEGIDISVCHMVVCFDESTNFKSFLQRRGRARKAESKFVMMEDGDDESAKAKVWEDLEADMIRIYQDDLRTLQDLVEGPEDEEGGRVYDIQTTGARLSFHNAVSHLWHFCNTLPSADHCRSDPDVELEDSPLDGGMFAKITLPNSVHPSVRTAKSFRAWKTEKMAKRDAAFEAMIALHKGGLINDNLLPLAPIELNDSGTDPAEKKGLIIDCREQHNPWIPMAEAWEGARSHSSAIVNFTDAHDEHCGSLVLTLPMDWPIPHDFHLYWRNNETLKVSCQKPQPTVISVMKARSTCLGLLRLGAKRRTPIDQSDFVALVTLLPEEAELNRLLTLKRERFPAVELFRLEALPQDIGLVINIMDYDKAFIPIRIFDREVEAPKEADTNAESTTTEKKVESCIEAIRFGKRTDFLHRPQNIVATRKLRIIPAENCDVERIPYRYAEIASLIPCLLYRVSTQMLATSLSKGLLGPLNISDTALILTAITAPQACEAYDYQSLEFLGDSVLKFVTTIHFYCNHPTWHEGYLSAKRDSIVSNVSLKKAATRTGLDAYIITRGFTGLKWKPTYISDLLAPQPERSRQLSSKILADVVEALLAVCFATGGMPSVIAAMRIFYPRQKWSEELNLIASPQPDFALPAYLQPLEKLTGHEFQHPHVLLEAMTHPSQMTAGMSYQRLEFLGDSVLSFLVVRRIMAASQSIAPGKMHLMQIVVVSADILAFLCMEMYVTQTRKSNKTVGEEIEDDIWASPKKRKWTVKDSFYKALSEQVPPPLYNGNSITRNLEAVTLSPDQNLDTDPFTSLPTSPKTQEENDFARKRKANSPLPTAITSESPIHSIEREERTALWSFMRHTSSAIPQAQKACLARHRAHRAAVWSALRSGPLYPWTSLARIGAEKIYSDLVESTLGAIYVDSAGDLAPCERFLENLGLTAILDRAIRDTTWQIEPPKSRLGEWAAKRLLKTRYEAGVVPVEHASLSAAASGASGAAAMAVSGPMWWCRVFVDDELVAEVGDARKREEAVTRGAELAVEFLVKRDKDKDREREKEEGRTSEM